MNIAIAKKGNDIITIKDYSDVDDRGEIAHMLAEIKIIEQDLLELWEKYGDPNLAE